ncbi:MAG: hypothetical protein RL648_1409, partial [Verrucomicrobiota bacterium]
MRQGGAVWRQVVLWTCESAADMLLLSMRQFSLYFILFFMTASAQAYQQAFPRTEPGVIEVKVLPAGRLLEATGTG